MSDIKKYPTPKEFLIDIPLYDKVVYDTSELEFGHEVKYFDGTFDSYCPECNSHSIFERCWGGNRIVPIDTESWVNSGAFAIKIQCTRNRSHKPFFYFYAEGNTLQKIGQFPSIAELNLFDVKKYSKVLNQNYFKEFTKAIGLAAHGVGVGSFVYLRRIFEFLISEAYDVASKSDLWDEEAYSKARMNEKIVLLKSELPPFLVENKSIYSILSKGIHELSEQECLAFFPALKVGIEIILDAKLELQERKIKLENAMKALSVISGNLKA